jgi:hypothetical protein
VSTFFHVFELWVSTFPRFVAPYAVLSGPGDKLYVSNWAGRRPKPGEPVANRSGSLVLVNPQNGVVPKIDRTLSVEPENMDTHLKMQ